MVIEIATVFVTAEAEADFVSGFETATQILRRQAGCRLLRWGKRVEPELAYVLEVEWDDIQDHFNFRETEDYVTFGGHFRPHLAKPPEVVSFRAARLTADWEGGMNDNPAAVAQKAVEEVRGRTHQIDDDGLDCCSVRRGRTMVGRTDPLARISYASFMTS